MKAHRIEIAVDHTEAEEVAAESEQGRGIVKAGGHFGCWTLKAINKYLDRVTTDVHVSPMPQGGYRCKDAFTGNEAIGKTPAEAARKVVAWVPPTCTGYN